MRKKALMVAIPVFLLLLAVLSYPSLSGTPQAVAALTIQVNPALTLTLDKKNKVLEAEGENTEGKNLLAGSSLKGKELKEALDEVTFKLHDRGFLAPDSEVIITVHPMNALDEEKLSSLSETAQQIMKENLSRYNVQRLDSFVVSHGLHTFLKELGLMPLDYVELLKENLSEEEIREVIKAIDRVNPEVKTLPFSYFDLEIESKGWKLSVKIEQKRYGVYALAESEEHGKREMKLEGSAALEHLLPVFDKLDINAAMSKEEIINRVLAAFDWNGPYDEFEITVKFADGSYIDFEWETEKHAGEPKGDSKDGTDTELQASSRTLYLHNHPTPPTGDTHMQKNLPMNSTSPTATRLYNYDKEKNEYPGREIKKDNEGTTTDDLTKYQTWISEPQSESLTIDGDVVLTLFTRHKDDNKRIKIRAILYVNGNRLAAAETSMMFYNKDNREFAKLIITFSNVNAAIPKDGVLTLRVFNLDDGKSNKSEDDAIIAYDTKNYPSNLLIPLK